MDSLIADVKYTLTSMRRDRGFAAAALATLALGIGATTAVFSVVYGVLLRPLPHPDSARLVRRRADIVGAAMTIERQQYAIVGVAEAGFQFPDQETQIWTPYTDPTLRGE
jgi:hypothetical protein